VQFIDGSAFVGVTLLSIVIESGNEIFVIENDFLIDGLDHKLICNFLELSEVQIGMNIEIVGSNWFSYCESLSSITFESNSCLTQIESFAFSSSYLHIFINLERLMLLQVINEYVNCNHSVDRSRNSAATATSTTEKHTVS
jgi:hypothetical protein